MKLASERIQPVYTVRANQRACRQTQVVAAVIAPSVGLGDREAFLRRFASDRAALPQAAITDIETMLQRLLPGTPTRAPR